MIISFFSNQKPVIFSTKQRTGAAVVLAGPPCKLTKHKFFVFDPLELSQNMTHSMEFTKKVVLTKPQALPPSPPGFSFPASIATSCGGACRKEGKHMDPTGKLLGFKKPAQ